MFSDSSCDGFYELLFRQIFFIFYFILILILVKRNVGKSVEKWKWQTIMLPFLLMSKKFDFALFPLKVYFLAKYLPLFQSFFSVWCYKTVCVIHWRFVGEHILNELLSRSRQHHLLIYNVILYKVLYNFRNMVG